MKKFILKITFFMLIALTVTSCKEKTAETAETVATEVAETSMVAADFNVDTEASVIEWKGSKPLKTHHGIIKLASGSIAVAKNQIEAGKFAMDMNSIEVHDLEGESKANLENHLRGTVEGKEVDFFNAPKYPFSTFILTGISESNGQTMVNGNLTIKDKTHTIAFPATVEIEDYDLKITSQPFELDRTKWDLNFKSKSVFDNLGDNFVDDEMELTIKLIAKKS